MFILIVDFVDLILEKLIVVAFFIVNDANHQQNTLYYYALNRTVESRSAISFLNENSSNT
jgi:hypothetical protein